MTGGARFIAVPALCVQLLFIALLSSCSSEVDRGVPIAVPKLGAGPVTLRVIYLENPRLPGVSATELQSVLATARVAVAAHFGINVRFDDAQVQHVDAYFRRIQEDTRRDLAYWIYDFKGEGGDRRHLKQAFESDIRASGEALDAVLAYARPYLLREVRDNSYGALVDALVFTQLTRLNELARQNAADGGPLLDANPYNEVVYWDSMAHFGWRYDITISNQIFASAEYSSNSVHSAIRGGITNGLTSRNPHSNLGTTAILSLYPFLGDDPVTVSLRGGEVYSRDAALRYAGTLLAHELGHQLLHLGHPYGESACIMSPPQLLRFAQWVRQLDAARCRVRSSRAMTPGVVKFYAPRPQH